MLKNKNKDFQEIRNKLKELKLKDELRDLWS